MQQVASDEQTLNPIPTLAALSQLCEPAREFIVLKWTELKLQKWTKRDGFNNLLYSLSRGAKILKQILIDQTELMEYIRETMLTSKTILKAVSNLSIESKCFMSNLVEFKRMSLSESDIVATFCIKNIGYNLPNPQTTYCRHIDLTFLEKTIA